MKTQFLSIAAALFVVFSVSNKTFAANNTFNNNNEQITVLSDVSSISKIEVHGNVELYVTSGEGDKVKVYNNYYSQNALVQSQNGVLRISSYAAEKLVVWITANDLRSITAYDNASVKSFGKFTALDLNLTLNNNATATIDLDCISTKVTLNDTAKADISGTASVSNMVVNHSATVNTTNFAAEQAVKTRIAPIALANNVDELALN